MKNKQLFKSTYIFSSMTFLSRLLGFARDMIIAHYFGADAQVDAFFVAFKIPNFLRRLFAEGAFAQAFVPVVSEYRQLRSFDEVKHFIRCIAGTLASALFVVTVLAIFASPWIIALFAPGFKHGSAHFEWASYMLRITFPYLFFISMTALSGAVLNSYGRFAVSSFTPVLLNLSMIATAIFLAPHLAHPIEALAWGVFFGGILQLAFQFPFLKRLKVLAWPKIAWRDSGVVRVLRLMGPAIFGVSVAQISLLIDTLFASFLPTGSISWLYYSERLMGFPLGVFGVALATVVLPNLSRAYANKSKDTYSDTMNWGLRCVLLIAIPAALGLFFLAGPLLATLFQYGQFNAFDVKMTSWSLMAFSLGIPAFMLVKILASGFYSCQNIRTPVRIAVITLVVSMLLNAALIIPLKHAGLALATSIAGLLNATLLFISLKRSKMFQLDSSWRKFILQSSFANLMLALFLYFMSAKLDVWIGWDWQSRSLHLLGLLFGAAVIYPVCLYATGMRWKDFHR